MSEEKQHPLSHYSNNEKIAYLSIVASLAAADNTVTDEEIANIRKLCKSVGLNAVSLGQVIATAEAPQTAPIKQYINQLIDSDLRFTLISDMLFLAYADSIYAEEERTEISKIAATLNVTSEQLSAIEEYVKAYHELEQCKESKTEIKKISGEVVSSLAAAGVPIAAVAISGSVWGLSTAGILSGLAALGLGLGLAPGIGVVAVIGVVSYFGVRWLYRNLTED